MSRTWTLVLVASLAMSVTSMCIAAYALVQLDRHADETARLATALTQLNAIRPAPQENDTLRRPPVTIDTSEE